MDNSVDQKKKHTNFYAALTAKEKKLFDSYPKTRSVLSKELQAIYKDHYKSNRDGATAATGLANKMETWLHKKIALDVEKNHNKKTLEIGAGTLNQLEYEESNHYDIIEPFEELFQKSPLLKKVKNVYADIDDIDTTEKYDRITSSAVFEHVTDLPKVIAKSCLLMANDGSLRTSIPNEGTFLWTLGYKMTTGIEFRIKHGLDYSELMMHEHVNTADEVDQLLNYFFEENNCQVFGVHKQIGFYRFYESKKPRVERAKKYLAHLSSES